MVHLNSGGGCSIAVLLPGFSGPRNSHKTALHMPLHVCLPCRIVVMDCPFPICSIPSRLCPPSWAQHYAAVIADMAHKDAALWAGISGEAFVLEATSLQLGSCWVAANYRRRDVEVPLEGRERCWPCWRWACRATRMASATAAARRSTCLCRDDPAKWPLWAYQAAEAVRAAPSYHEHAALAVFLRQQYHANQR